MAAIGVNMEAANAAEFLFQRDLLGFLESEGHLHDLATTGLKYLEAIKKFRSRGMIGPPLCFRPELNLSRITSISENLFGLLVREPELAERLLQKLTLHVFLECLNAKDLKGGLKASQILTPLRIANENATNLLHSEGAQGLILLKGVLSACTTPTKYIRSSVVRCKNECCLDAPPRRLNGAWVKGCFCRTCRHEEVEVAEERDVGEQVLATFLPLDGLNVSRRGKTKAKTVIFKDELITGLTLGCQLQVICRPATGQNSTSHFLMACSKPETFSPANSMQISRFPEAVRNLYSTFGNSPWASVAVLAMNLAKEVVPYGFLFNIRLGAILSMASQGSVRPFPLLVTGQENVLASRVLYSAAEIATRSVSHGCQNALCGLAKKSEDARQDIWIEAGSLLLSSHGICLVGDWMSLKKESRADIISAIENGSITIKMPNKPMHFPMKASVWTYCQKLDKKSLKPMINVFGMPFIADISEEDNMHLAYFFLNNALTEKETDPENYLSDSDMKHLLSAISGAPVRMSERASHLITNYFVASRRARATGGSTEECLPIGAVQSMSTMAEAHARLSLRSEIIPEDALVAISLYEQSLVALFGPAFQAPPPPLSGGSLSSTNLLQSVDDYMHAMSQWLENYIKALIGMEYTSENFV